MTAFAISWEKNRLAVASDTLAYHPDRHQVRPMGFISKILPLPGLKSVLFSRGQYQITVNAFAGLLLWPQLTSIEDAAGILPELLREATDAYCVQQGIDDPTAVGLLEVVMAGWSPVDRRMKLFQFFNVQNYVAFDAGEHYCVTPFPQIPSVQAAAGRATDRDLVRIVQAIGAEMERDPETWCGQRIGGEIVSTHVTPSGIEHRVLHRFPDYEITRNASAAVCRRIMSGEVDISTVVRDGLVPVVEMMVDTETGEKLVA